MVNLAFLHARHMAGPAIQRCLQVIHTNSHTVVYIMYYTANVATPAGRERRRMHACSRASEVVRPIICDLCICGTISVVSRDANDIIMISLY